MMNDYLQSIIIDQGQWCPNCDTAWRILKPEVQGEMLRIIEECYACGDEEFDIYEVEEDIP